MSRENSCPACFEEFPSSLGLYQHKCGASGVKSHLDLWRNEWKYKADTEEDAANLALDVAQLSDAEPIDFLLKDPDVVEILPWEVPEAFVWTSKTVKQKI